MSGIGMSVLKKIDKLATWLSKYSQYLPRYTIWGKNI